ncbi:MAG: class I adenylate-forming enzyme family protein [Pseudonocardia sediminis]
MADRPDVVAALLDAAREHPAAPALTGPDGETLTHRELSTRIVAVASRLREAGFAPGERMLFSVRPGPDSVVLALGVVAAGGCVVFLDPGVGPELFAARTGLARARWAAAESMLYTVGRRPLRPLARRRGVLLPDYAALPVRHVHTGRWLPGVPRGALALSDLQRPVGIPEPPGTPVRYAPEQDAVVVFTAGTTASPRAVVHTRGSLGSALDVLAARCALGPGSRVHTHQFLLGLPALTGGGHWSMPPYGLAPGSDPDEIARGLTGATHTFLVPADLSALLDRIADGVLPVPPRLRQVLVGAAPVLAPLLRRASSLLPGVEILAVYGMTEILPVAVATATQKLAFDGDGDLLGAPLPGVRVRVDDDGHLLVRGPNMARGHLGGPELTEHDTGDLARIEAGRIVLVGRAKDMIIRKSTNIYPGLYEPAVADLPGVAEAYLVGVPDGIGDERVVLLLRPAQGAPADLADRVREVLPRIMDSSALPDRVLTVTNVPRDGRTRKPDRTAMTRLAAHRLEAPVPAPRTPRAGSRFRARR